MTQLQVLHVLQHITILASQKPKKKIKEKKAVFLTVCLCVLVLTGSIMSKKKDIDKSKPTTFPVGSKVPVKIDDEWLVWTKSGKGNRWKRQGTIQTLTPDPTKPDVFLADIQTATSPNPQRITFKHNAIQVFPTSAASLPITRAKVITYKDQDDYTDREAQTGRRHRAGSVMSRVVYSISHCEFPLICMCQSHNLSRLLQKCHTAYNFSSVTILIS
jgi:hypothetical protein